MKLSVKTRLMLSRALPQEQGFVKGLVIDSLQAKLAITVDELDE